MGQVGSSGAVAAVCVVALVIVVIVLRSKSSAVRVLRSLYAAIRAGNGENVAMLLANQGVVNSKDAKGWTPLHRAANHGQSLIRSLLLKRCGGHRVDGRITTEQRSSHGTDSG
jgi:Ankyrin repeats (3 copies)